MPLEALSEELDLIFEDFGEAVILRRRTVSVDSATGVRSTVDVDQPARAVVGSGGKTPTAPTGGRARVTERTFLLRAAEIPADFHPPLAHLLHEGRLFRVVAERHAADASMRLFETREVEG